jgi:hypothetical protein
MKLNVRAAAATSALIWGGAVLTVGVANLIQPRYGGAFLRMIASIYPGYRHRRTAAEVAIGTGYALVDGAFGGAMCAWLYNRCIPETADPMRSAEPIESRSGSVSSVA